MNTHAIKIAFLGTLLLVAACAPSGYQPTLDAEQRPAAAPATAPSSIAQTAAPQAAIAHPTLVQAAAVPAPQGEDTNRTALEQLWQARTAGDSAKSSSEFTLGPGDVLQISIPQIPQLGNRVERVSESSTISLPLLGEINVAGMTQEDLLHTLSQRTAKYVYHPQVDLFIQHTEARQVAVIGAVKNPGRYPLASKRDTIMTMIGRAGGMTETAGSRIILLPGSGHGDLNLAAADAGAGDSAAPGPRRVSYVPGESAPGPVNPALRQPPDSQAGRETGFGEALRSRIVISTTSADDQRYLDLPAKPGDVILIPAAGQVTVQGWVDKPGAFPISPGMTVLSSIAAAGGAVFTDSATLLREQDDGRKLDIRLDISKLKSGQQRDVQVQSGDVVVVERSAVGAVPYTLYFLINKVGIGIAATPFF